MAPRPAEPNGNAVRVTNKEIYLLLLEVRDVVIEERQKRISLQRQVTLLWTTSFGLVSILLAAAVKAFSG